MANVKKGNLTRAGQWWDHLRDWKRRFWKAERQAHKAAIADEAARLEPQAPAICTCSSCRPWTLPRAPEVDQKHPAGPRCDCRRCIRERGDTISGWPRLLCEMILCPTCGNKRCPHANDHRNACTWSNEPGQPGSAYT